MRSACPRRGDRPGWAWSLRAPPAEGVSQGGALAASSPDSALGPDLRAPTLEVWLVTISAATQVLTSSALLKSCNRYLSWT